MAMFWIATVEGKHLREADVVAVQKRCEAAEAPIFDRIRQRKQLECEQHEKRNRGDPKTCAVWDKDIGPGASVILDPPLPVCDQAFEARKHFGLYPARCGPEQSGARAPTL